MNTNTYRFVKIAPKFGDKRRGTWYLNPKSVEQVQEHFNKIFGKEIRAGIQDKITDGNKHPSTAWRSTVDTVCHLHGYGWNCQGLTWLSVATSIETQVINNRIQDFQNGLDFYLPNGVQEFIPSWDMYEIIEEVYKDTLEYPNEELFHLEDVRYMQWDLPNMGVKGVHWYAKIGNKDVKDKNGNMKWNTKEEAEEAARWFCQELNFNHYHKYE